MGTFSSDKEVYARIGRMLQELCADERAGAQLQRADTVVQYRLRDPQATVTLKALAGQDRQVELGETQLRPEVVVLMDGDTAHDYWAGELNVAVALADGRIKPRGPSSKILALVPMLKLAIPRYRELMEQPLELPQEEPAAEPPAAEEPAAALEEPTAEGAEQPDDAPEQPEAAPEEPAAESAEAPEAAAEEPEVAPEAPAADPPADGERPPAEPPESSGG